MSVSARDIKYVQNRKQLALRMFMRTGQQRFLHEADSYDKQLVELKRTQYRQLH